MRAISAFRAAGITFGALPGLVFSLVILEPAICRAEAAANQPPAPPAANAKVDQAAKLVQQALQAEAAGKPTERDALLKQALAIAPDYAPAHWQSGEVKSGNAWASIDDAAKHDAHSAKLDEYRQRRDQAAATVDDQLNLARWCEKKGLKEQQRAHLMFVLELQPNNKEAISKLGLVRYRGQLVPTDQLDEIKDQVKQSFAESKEWKQQVAQWQQQLREQPKTKDDILKQIRSIRDPVAILSLEKMLSNSGPEVGKAIIDCLTAMPQQAATESLVRFALFSPYDDVAHAAAYSLKSRSPFSYVPLLIARLQSPIHVEYEVVNFDAFNFTHQLQLFRSGSDHDDVSVNYASTTTSSPLITVGQGSLYTPLPPDLSAMRTAATAAQQQQKVGRIVEQVQQINNQNEANNALLAELLETTTGQQLGDDPEAWWEWWYDYNDYYRPDYTPVDYTSNISNSYSAFPREQYFYNPAPPPRRTSCFPAGTPVWTMSGPMQIENIKVGELVLAQDTETGELAYKPVIDTTIRPASPVIETKLGETEIRSTRGHPFWVAGVGWQMAKELKAGQWLHTAHGMVQIDSAEPGDEAVCFNLVVADFHDYFVSGAKLLVHDNLLRGPTLATVPGLAEGK